MDSFYQHYDTAYEYVDGHTTVTAREALGLATSVPTYDEDPRRQRGSRAAANSGVTRGHGGEKVPA